LYVLALGCATPRPSVSALPEIPPPRDLELVIGPAPQHKIPAGLDRYEDIPIDPGTCPGKPAGILVSEGRYADGLVCKLERDRLGEEAGALRRLRQEENAAAQAAEFQYRVRVRDLEAHASQAERVATMRLWIGIAIGAGGMLAATWAGARAAR
jgi:hypothetical protein